VGGQPRGQEVGGLEPGAREGEVLSCSGGRQYSERTTVLYVHTELMYSPAVGEVGGLEPGAREGEVLSCRGGRQHNQHSTALYCTVRERKVLSCSGARQRSQETQAPRGPGGLALTHVTQQRGQEVGPTLPGDPVSRGIVKFPYSGNPVTQGTRTALTHVPR